jgi:hypothetical protein
MGTTSMAQARQLPPMPPIGQPESFYARQVQFADKMADPHAHEAYKVGQYVTLATDPRLPWESKLKYFDHALRRHCIPPPLPDEDVWMFYRSLADLVRQYAGLEALKMASMRDDEFAQRAAAGERRENISEDAEEFFEKLMGLGMHKPSHFTDEDWNQLKLIRDQWV